MAKKKDESIPYEALAVALGPVSIDTSMLQALDVESFSQNGVILTNERTKITLKDTNGVPVGYTLSLYIQRDPVTDDERVKVLETKDERTKAKTEREQKEADRLSREKRAAFDLGQESSLTALRNIDTLVSSVNGLKAIGRMQSSK
jgi:hypothetical protein